MVQPDSSPPTTCDLKVEAVTDSVLQVTLSGPWTLASALPAADRVLAELTTEPPPLRVAFDTGSLAAWDSGLLTFLLKILEQCAGKSIAVNQDGLPEGVRRLLALATAVPERKGARRDATRPPFITGAELVVDGGYHAMTI